MHWQPFQKVIKVGDSLAVVIPAPIVHGLEIFRGDVVSISAIASDKISIKLFTPQEIAVIIKNNPSINNGPIT